MGTVTSFHSGRVVSSRVICSTLIRVRPQVGSLARVEGKVPTAKGPVRVRVEGGVLTLDVPAPARVEWAGAVHDVAVGHHVFPAGK